MRCCIPLFSFERQLCTFHECSHFWVGISVCVVFSFNIKDNNIFPECACLHKTVNIVVFIVKSNENTYAKGRALMHMYRVVSITKRGNSLLTPSLF